MSEELLPLFPLQVVLFPNSILPLHIFEERYKQLINECLEERKEFGINLAQGDDVAKVGCTAEVTKLLKRFDDGKMDILVQGKRRYSLVRFEASTMLYSVARVEFISTNEELTDGQLAAETVALHNQLIELVHRDTSYKLAYEPDNMMLSFKVAQKAGMELTQRQELLELNSENERLRVLHTYFTEVIPKLARLGEVERVIKSDGYIVN